MSENLSRSKQENVIKLWKVDADDEGDGGEDDDDGDEKWEKGRLQKICENTGKH